MSRYSRRKEAAAAARAAGGKFTVGASMKKLATIKNEIPFYTLEEMAKYVDGVTSNTPNDIQLHGTITFELQQMTDFDIYDKINSTSFGNAAFLLLNSDESIIKEGARSLIDRVRGYVEFLGKSPELDEDGFFNPNK
jgi:hypothetical protein